MANSIHTQLYESCCGCKACADVCPRNAISFKTDAEGFWYPDVNADCVGCGHCRKVCPELNIIRPVLEGKQQYFACLDKNKERRNSGSSGGVFGLLATVLISEGYTVCGAAFEKDLQLKHQFAVDSVGIERLKKSKYIQSDCASVYAQISKKLKYGKKIMFVGTPCQCNALLNSVGDTRKNLIVVDFACHGVPSQELFDRCIKYYEEKHGCKVMGYSFRHKSKRYGCPQNFLLRVHKGGKVSLRVGPYYDEPFYCGFQKYITLRPSCYSCPWSNTDRVSDITLADFWGIETVTDEWDRTDHPSLLIVNTNKGKDLFDSIKNEMSIIETSKEKAVKYNVSLVHSTKLLPERAELFSDYNRISFEELVNKHLVLKGRWKKDLYYSIPFPIRKVFLRLTNNI